jgi:nucleoside-diphosphate-sugar epimerase
MIFLTGAAGSIGAKVARRLVERSLSVRCLALPGESVGALGGLSVEVVRGDVTDIDTFVAQGSGVDTVVHCAAAMLPERAERIQRVNVDGTANVLRFAERHGARRFVYVSAVSAVYRDKNAYGRSKAEAERLVAESGLDHTILRPSGINEDAAIDDGPFRDECGYDPVALETGLAQALMGRR